MMERSWPAVGPVAFIAQGTARGRITIASTAGFRVKMEVILTHPTLPSVTVEIKRVLSASHLILGPTDKGIDAYTDVSAYNTDTTIASTAQRRPNIPLQELERASYEEEPVVAKRVIQVDELGMPLRTTATNTGNSLVVNVPELQNLSFTQANELKISDSWSGSAQGQEIAVTKSPCEAVGSARRLAGRKGLILYASSPGNYFGFGNSVSTSNGIPIFQNQMVWVPASSAMQVWLVRESGSGLIRVWEVG